MRKIILLLAITFSPLSFANEWKISVDKNKGIVSYVNGEMTFSYPQMNVVPEVKEVKKIAGFNVVIFFAKSSGSFVMLEEMYGAVFDQDNDLKGIYPYKYEVVSETKHKINQPTWKVSGKKLIITEPEYDEKFTLDIP